MCWCMTLPCVPVLNPLSLYGLHTGKTDLLSSRAEPANSGLASTFEES